ncbi:hypothetical protein TL16_g10796 [Triparma laevis f. inornata]|uniref:Uncharacterized protein n=1 Tax=Triparma laevis f. inornata TaxID=1714386 RepID=A0A9W7ERM2_9STRA|nr:hypothetical protein TL16_g10796 [Triparma laevis f. inornata]
MSSRSGSPLKKTKGAPSKPPLHIDSATSVPDNSIYHKFRPDSTPKRAIRDEHSIIKEKINSIVNNYSDYADSGLHPNPNSLTSRHHLDSLFEDFETMAKGKDETLDEVHSNLKRSELVGSEMLKGVEEDINKSGSQTNLLCQNAKNYLESSLSKLAECMKSNKQLTATDMIELQKQISDGLSNVKGLERDVEKHLMALGNKSKEFDKFRQHTSSKIIGMKKNYEKKLEDLMVELRDTEIKFEERDDKCKEFEKQMLREARRRSVIQFEDVEKVKEGWEGKERDSKREKSSSEDNGVPTSEQYHKVRKCDVLGMRPFVTKLTRRFAPHLASLASQKIRDLEAQLADKTKEVTSLKLDLDHHEIQEIQRKKTIVAQAKTKKTSKASTTQTDAEEEATQYPNIKPTEDPFIYLENYLTHHSHPSPNNVLEPFRDLKKKREKGEKENGDLMRSVRVLEKKLEDAIKTVEKNKKTAAAAAATPTVTGPDEESLKKLKQLEMKLKDSESKNEALKLTLDSTASILSSTTDKLTASGQELASEKMKAAGIAVLIKTKEKQLHSVKTSLKDQKEALDDLLKETGNSDVEEKKKYIELMKELDAKLETLNKQQAEVSEQKMMLDIKNQELETLNTDLTTKQMNLNASLQDFKLQTEELQEREESFASQEATLNRKLETLENASPVSDAPSAATLNQINALKEQLAEFKSLSDAEDEIQKKKDALFEGEAEMEMKEQHLQARKDEYEKSSTRLTQLEQELEKLESTLQLKEEELQNKRKALEEKQAAIEAAEEAQNKLEEADLDLIAVLTEEVDALKAEIATLNSIIDSKAPKPADPDASNPNDRRPTTTHEELRRMNKDYEEQMNNMTKLRAELENKKSELDAREITLTERTKNVEDHLASELQRVQELTTSMTGLAPPGEISNLSFDWYNPDFKAHPNQFLAFLAMVENWVAGMKTKTYLQKDENITDIKLEKGEEPETFNVILSDKHVSPIHAIFELHQTALTPPLRRKLQHIVLQVEKFGGIFTPLSAHTNMCNHTDDIIKEAKRHLTMIEELEIEVIAGEKLISGLIKQNQSSPMMNWATVKKAMKRWAEKLEFFGRIVGKHVAIQNRSEEMRELQTGYMKAIQENCSEKETESLNIFAMASLSDALLNNIGKAENKLNQLTTRKESINEQVSTLISEYERVTARDQGNELATSFDPKFSDVFVNPDDDMVDPELVKELRDEIEALQDEIENLKSDKYEKAMEGDGSYGGLMFFAFLQESHFEEKLGRIVTEVTELHDSSHGKGGAHLSFSELQKMVDHIQRVRMPLLVKIKNRYGKLHKKWQNERMRRMKDMGLAGGEGDAAAVCPICNVDKRNVKLDRREGAKPLNGGTGQLSKKIEKPVKMVNTASNVLSFSQKWKRRSLHKEGNDDASISSNTTNNNTQLAMSASDGALRNFGGNNTIDNDDSSQSSFSKTMNSPAMKKKPKPTDQKRVQRKSKERLELTLDNSGPTPAKKRGSKQQENPSLFDNHEQSGWDQGGEDELENSVKLPDIGF